MIHLLVAFEQVESSDNFVETSETHLCKLLPDSFSKEVKKGYQVFCLSEEPLAQFRILGGDSDRTGIEVTFPHHHTAKDYQGAGCETEFLGTKQCRNYNIFWCFELSVSLEDYLSAKVAHNQRLLCFGKTKLKRDAGMFDR